MANEENIEYKRFIISLVPPAIILLIIWLVKIIEVADGLDLYYYGIYPRKTSGLIGIAASPFIHANFNHLLNNSVPFFLLLTAIFYFYHKVAWRVLFFSWLASGIVVWVIARSSYHIGASGLIYGFAAFLLLSGIVRRNINLMAISLLVIFLYGSMVWGIFPYRPDMSWESHLVGLTIGALLAIHYRHEGPGPTRFISDMEDEEDDKTEGAGIIEEESWEEKE
ncbi:MAG: rhomboid family intramembrane serine protease [Bacteroidales bacterium]|nr:rhomboid family intramembrane serine protease [Bacteroidales bacterium]